jgi:hypothetical protein
MSALTKEQAGKIIFQFEAAILPVRCLEDLLNIADSEVSSSDIGDLLTATRKSAHEKMERAIQEMTGPQEEAP